MTEKDFYNNIKGIENSNILEVVEKLWKDCFTYILKKRDKKYTRQTINDLFYNFEMCNWKAMWKENTEYSSHSKDELKKSFYIEIMMNSDRFSLDRLFRTHWLFLRWKDEVEKEKF